MRLNKFLASERGSILVEATGFAVLAFGLVLTLSIQVFELERRVIGLESLARNAMRNSLLSSDFDFQSIVFDFQNLDPLLSEEDISVSTSCSASQCSRSGELIWLEISIGNAKAKVFGVAP